MDGFGIRYLGRLASADGHAYHARLWQRGHAGASAEVDLTEDAIRLTLGRRGADINTPILASTAEVQGWRLADGRGALTALVGARTGDWLLEIVRAAFAGGGHEAIEAGGGERVWLGQVKTDVYEDSTLADPAPVDVVAVDGLGTLKEQPYYDVTSEPGERLPYIGPATLLSVLRRALSRTGFELPIRSAVAWRPAGLSGDPLGELYVNDQRAFYGDDGTAMSCYEIAREVALRLGCQLVQWAAEGDEAAWWLRSRELLDGKPYEAHRYGADGEPDSGEPTMMVGFGVEAGEAVRLAGRRTYRPAFGAVGVTQAHGVVPPLISEGDFEEVRPEEVRKVGRWKVTIPPAYGSSTWAYTGEAETREADPESRRRMTSGGTSEVVAVRNFVHAVRGFRHGWTRYPEAVKRNVVEGRDYGTREIYDLVPSWAECASSEMSGEGQVLTFSGVATIRRDQSSTPLLANTYWALRLIGDEESYYLQRDGTWAGEASWVTDNHRAQFLCLPGEEDQDQGIDLDVPFTFSFTSEPAPVKGTLVLRLYGSSQPGGILQGRSVGWTEWDDVAVVVAAPDGSALGATRTEVFTTDAAGYPLPDPERADVEVRLGEGPAQLLPTTLLRRLSLPVPVLVAAVDWSSDQLPGARRLDDLHAQTYLRSQAKPLESRAEQYRGLAASPLAPVMVGSQPFAPAYIERAVYHDEAEVELVEMAWDSALTVTSEAGQADPAGTVYLPGAGGGGTSASSTGVGAGERFAVSIAVAVPDPEDPGEALLVFWDAVPGAEGYEVSHEEDVGPDGGPPYATAADTPAPPYRIEGLSSGTTYRVGVRAYRDDGED